MNALKKMYLIMGVLFAQVSFAALDTTIPKMEGDKGGLFDGEAKIEEGMSTLHWIVVIVVTFFCIKFCIKAAVKLDDEKYKEFASSIGAAVILFMLDVLVVKFS